MDTPDGPPVLRIGELSRHAPGVSDHVLRAWESRYGLLQPVRSAGASGCTPRRTSRGSAGCRATSPAGCRPPRRRERCSGRTAGPGRDAGRAAGPRRAAPAAGELPGALRQALDAFDEPAAQAALDRLMSDLSLTAVLRDVVLPYLTELGERWERGTAASPRSTSPPTSSAGGAPGWPGAGETGTAPAPSWPAPRGASRPGADGLRHRAQPQRMEDRLPRDEHPGRGAGADGRARRPDLVVLAATLPENLEPHATQLTALARRAPLALAEPAPPRRSPAPWGPGC